MYKFVDGAVARSVRRGRGRVRGRPAADGVDRFVGDTLCTTKHLKSQV